MRTLFNNAKNLFTRYGLLEAPEIIPAVREDGPVVQTERLPLLQDLADAFRKTHRYYLGRQHLDGYWWYELESNVTIVSEYLMLLHFLGIADGQRDRKIARHILRNRRADGTWALYHGGRGDLSTTVEAYFALKLAGHSVDDEVMQQARRFILAEGGVEASRVFTKIYLALFGQFPWSAIPSIPVEITLFPAWFPLNIYNFSSWARSTVVPLSLVLECKPVRAVPDRAGVRELFQEPDKVPSLASSQLSPFSWKRIFIFLDRFVKACDGLPLRPLKKKAMRKTEQWILEHQEPTGDWGGIQPAMVNSILALSALGYGTGDGPVRKGVEALKRFVRESDDELALQSCISPVWDTALTSLALLSSGVHKDHPSLLQATAWLSSKQIFQKGDWSVKRPSLEPGGWAFEFDNSWYPDIDDTAVVLLLLKKYADKDVVKRENLYKALQWILGMQGKDGGWGAFDVDNDMRVFNQLLFGDLEAMIDPSTPDLTGRVLELLGAFGYGMPNEVVQRGLSFIKANQEPEGSWWGRWGVNHLYGTCTVLMGIEAVGETMSRPYIRKAVAWLKSKQNSDGGWGESCDSYHEAPSNKCTPQSTPSQTAWALLALMAAGEVFSIEAQKGATNLLERQNPDGTWDEEAYTGTGFPKYFYLRYGNYRNCFPLMALGKIYFKYSRKGNRP
jgi:squalene-hopene/tetraprenyl-beta-curcumene cyclase